MALPPKPAAAARTTPVLGADAALVRVLKWSRDVESTRKRWESLVERGAAHLSRVVDDTVELEHVDQSSWGVLEDDDDVQDRVRDKLLGRRAQAATQLALVMDDLDQIFARISALCRSLRDLARDAEPDHTTTSATTVLATLRLERVVAMMDDFRAQWSCDLMVKATVVDALSKLVLSDDTTRAPTAAAAPGPPRLDETLDELLAARPSRDTLVVYADAWSFEAYWNAGQWRAFLRLLGDEVERCGGS